MSSAAVDRENELRARLEALPATVKGEIIDGELYTQPRPRPRHTRIVSALGSFIGGPMDFEPGGPGGWVILEVLSRSNAAYDRKIKFPFYASVGVGRLWVVDPFERTVEVRELVDRAWVVRTTFAGDEPLRAPPFEAIEVPLERLWVKA